MFIRATVLRRQLKETYGLEDKDLVDLSADNLALLLQHKHVMTSNRLSPVDTNPLLLDPSRTTALRNAFSHQMLLKFEKLKGEIWKLLVTEDALGHREEIHNNPFTAYLKEKRKQITSNRLLVNKRFKFLTSDEKLKAFIKWFNQQVDKGILASDPNNPGQPWTTKYVESAFKKGWLRSYYEAKEEDPNESEDWKTGKRQQFLNRAFNQPEQMDKIRLLGTRCFEQLKGITGDMSAKLSRVLALGIANGQAPRTIARQISKEINGITNKRALVLARTEIQHAHAEGQLNGFQELGIKELHLNVEWQNAGDKRVCRICNKFAGTVYTIAQARGLIPFHPDCRCGWGTTSRKVKTKKNKQQIVRAKLVTNKWSEAAWRARWAGHIKKLPLQKIKEQVADAGVIQSGSLAGISPSKLAEWMGAKGFTKSEAQNVLSSLKQSLAKSQFDKMHKWGQEFAKKGISKNKSPISLTPEQTNYVNSLKSVIPPVSKPIIINPPVVPLSSFDEVKKGIAAFGMNLVMNMKDKEEGMKLSQAIHNQLQHLNKFSEIAKYIQKAKQSPPSIYLESKSTLSMESAFKDGSKAVGIHYAGDGTFIAGEAHISKTNEAPSIGGYAVSNSFDSLFAHEYGHQIWYNHMNIDQRNAFEKTFSHYLGPNKKDVSLYAATNIKELWAESFAAYTNQKYKPGMLPKDLEEWMHSMLGHGEIPAVLKEGEHVMTFGGLAGSSKFTILPNKLGGSTGAKQVRITWKSGFKSKAVMKTYSGNEDQVRNEWLANKLYEKFGAPMRKTSMGKVDGKEALFGEWIDNLKTLGSANASQRQALEDKIRDHFVVDAWLANWDVIGMSDDNIGFNHLNNPFRIDNGGALLFRAQGAPKGAAFGKEVTELNTMRDPNKNSHTAAVFGKISDVDIVKQIDNFQKHWNAIGGQIGLKTIIDKAGFDEATSKKLLETLDARYQNLLQQKPIFQDKALASEKIAKAAKEAELAKFKAENNGWAVPWPKPAERVYDNYKDLYADAEQAFKKMNNIGKGAVKEYTGSSYKLINKAAKYETGQYEKDPSYEGMKKYLPRLDSALNKLPSWNGMSARGVKMYDEKDWDNWKSGLNARYEMSCYGSASIQPGKEFGKSTGVCLLIKNKGLWGAFVQPGSSIHHEVEITCKRGAKYQVVGWAESDIGVGSQNHRKFLLIEEVSPDNKVPMSQAPPKQYDAHELWKTYVESAKKAGISGY